MRKLIIAWVITLSFFVGVISWLQISYEPATETDAVFQEANLEEEATAATPAPADIDPGPMPTLDDSDVTEQPLPERDSIEPRPIQAESGADLQPEPSPAGVANLVEDGPYGPIPVTRNGQQPWQAHAREYDSFSSRPRVAIVISGLGLNQRTTIEAINTLPPEVTMAFSPYGQDLENWAREARATGHELLIMVPMEPLDYPVNDPGPHSLLTSLSPAENIDNLHYVMSRFPDFVGLMNDMGSRFTASEESLRPIMSDLQRRGVLFLDARTTNATILPAVARSYGVPAVSNSRYIDNVASASEIDRYLAELEEVARMRGSSIGIGRSYPVTIARISEWSKTLDQRGIDLVPITAIVRP